VEEDSTTCVDAKMSNDKEENMMLEPQNFEENMTNEKEESLELGTPRT